MTLYVRQLQLRERIAASHDEFVVWDVGLGAAANPVTALRSVGDLPCRIHVESFDRTTAPQEFALQHANELAYLDGFTDPLRQLIATREVKFTTGACEVHWTLHVNDFPSLVSDASRAMRERGARLIAAPHVIFYDAFSPARNPEMWTLPLLSDLFALLMPDRPCSLATFSRSTMTRAALLLAGFFVGPGEPLAGKEETTVAANAPALLPKMLTRMWLERARRSHSAEPLRAPAYQQQALSEQSWQTLRAHPQFAIEENS
jgi:queuine tRNA-ribosyltransferase